MSISIIIPTYNSEKYLDVCLSSLMSSLDDVWEVVVVDDGSSDGTSDMIARKYPFVIYQKIDNSGPARARNIWAWIASWAILCFIDADVSVTPWRLNTVLTIYDERSIAVLGWKILNTNKEYVSEMHHLIEFGAYTWSASCLLSMVPSANLVVSKKIFDDIWWFNESLKTWEDNDFCQKASKYWHVFYDPNLLVSHDTQWWRKKICTKQKKFGKHFLTSRDQNPHLGFQLPRNKRLLTILFLPLLFGNMLLLMRKPYFWQKWLKFISLLPLLLILRMYFWIWVIDSLD